MAGIWPVIRALARVAMREQNRVSGILANNLFWVLYLIGQGGAGLFVMVMVGAVALFPLCADPFRKLPVERIGTWPLTARNLHLIRIVSIFLSPAAWIALATILWTRRPQFLLLAFFLIAFAVPFPKSLAFRAVPGIFGELVRKNVRELLTLLDPYVALLFSASAILYRLARPAMEDDARITMSLVVVVTLSTCAQCLFALDAGPGLDRYRLMPIRGWRVLAAKHAAHLLVALPLTLPIHPIAPIAGLLVSLGIGNHMAVTNPRLQSRWSLTAGSLIPGLFQSAAIIAAGLNATREPIWIGAFALFYVVSTLFYGWRLDSQSRGQAGR